MEAAMQGAVTAARRGWPVFPVLKNGKTPLIKEWERKASTDLAQIQQWNLAYPDCNWGIACGPANLVVVDRDVKDTSIDSAKSIAHLELDTYTVATPSGGNHYYYDGKAQSRVRALPGIDTRSAGGYVLAQGSSLDAKYYTIARDLPVARASADVIKLATAKAEPVKKAVDVEVKQEPAALRAADYLATVAPAIENQGGNNQTFKVAAQVRDWGVAQDGALELMLKHYNPRCVPPWSEPDLARIVMNCYKFAQNDEGARSPEADFTPVPVVATPYEDIPTLRGSQIDIANIPKRDWVLEGRYVGGYVTAIVSPGGVGKSMLSMLDAVAIVTGRNLTGAKVIKQGNVWLHNAEDPETELRMRLAAICIHHNIDPKELDGLHITSGRQFSICLAKSHNGRVVIDGALVCRIEQFLRKEKIVMWGMDPFVQVHACNENDNTEMAQVMAVLQHASEVSGAAIGLSHHARKGKGDGEDIDSSRGASAVANAARLAFNLSTMSEEDAHDLGISDEQRRWFLRLDNAKANILPPASRASWWKRESVTIPCGEDVGTLSCVDLKQDGKALDAEARDIIRVLPRYLAPGEEKSMGVLAALIRGDTMISHLFEGQCDRTVARALERVLQYPVTSDGVEYSVTVEPSRGRSGKVKLAKAVSKDPKKLLGPDNLTPIDKQDLSIGNLLE
jgi:hypothetical protein